MSKTVFLLKQTTYLLQTTDNHINNTFFGRLFGSLRQRRARKRQKSKNQRHIIEEVTII